MKKIFLHRLKNKIILELKSYFLFLLILSFTTIAMNSLAICEIIIKKVATFGSTLIFFSLKPMQETNKIFL